MPSSSPPESGNEPSILRGFASLIGLLGPSLFFTGWIYRWVYFFQFHLELTTLDFSIESFFIVPIQVILGDTSAIIRAVIAIMLMVAAIHVTLWFISGLKNIEQWDKISQIFSAHLFKTFAKLSDRVPSFPYSPDPSAINAYSLPEEQSELYHKTVKVLSKIFQALNQLFRSLIHFNPLTFDAVKVLRSLVDETVIVAWVLIILFHLARTQAIQDAQRDMGINSTLPVVTFIVPDEQIPLGRQLDDPANNNLPIEGFRFFGDKEAFKHFINREDTLVYNPEKPTRVWRLLLERDGWIYLLPQLQEKKKSLKVPASWPFKKASTAIN